MTLLNPSAGRYAGCPVSPLFTSRWRSRKHVGAAAPWMEVSIRRGHFKRRYHTNWPNPQFGQVVGKSIRHQWYADWTPTEDWITFDAVHQVQLQQSFDNNGIAVATIDLDNEEWQETAGVNGLTFHTPKRGIYWPWRGYVPPGRPGTQETRNQWWNKLPNAQILVRQGYGPDAAAKTFTGLIDHLSGEIRPDRMTLSCRDFGGVLTDEYLFGWNKDKQVNDPITFVPHNYWRMPWVIGDGKSHRWIKIKDACDIVRCCLRWAGFKDWDIEDSGVDLMVPATFDKTKSYMDVINAVKEQLGYVFFMGEPDQDDDRSIGIPVFRRPAYLEPQRSRPITLTDSDFLTDSEPIHDNTNERYIIRVRGVINNKVGRYLDNPAYGGNEASDTAKRVGWQYWPPWQFTMSGVLKQLTYYNVGEQGVLGFRTRQECRVAAILIAIQIALSRHTQTAEVPGQPKLGLDTYAFILDQSSGVASRLYITNRTSVMQLGGDGSSVLKNQDSTGSGSNQMLWSTTLGGALIDDPEMARIFADYHRAARNGKPLNYLNGHDW